MSRDERASWNQEELADVLAEYFGEKLSPTELEHLTRQTATALEEHGRLPRQARRDPGGSHETES